jgi:hypothetical protein
LGTPAPNLRPVPAAGMTSQYRKTDQRVAARSAAGVASPAAGAVGEAGGTTWK